MDYMQARNSYRVEGQAVHRRSVRQLLGSGSWNEGSKAKNQEDRWRRAGRYW